MSWQEKTNTNFTIITGDGKTYTPEWKDASNSIEFNIASFDFKNIPGTLLKRSQPKGSVYPLKFYFQGDDNLDKSKAFKESSKDSRPWTIQHPFYGNLLVHPVSLEFNDTSLNVTIVTGTVMETIKDEYPNSSVNPIDLIKENKSDSDYSFLENYVNNIPSVDLDGVRDMTILIDNFDSSFTKLIQTDVENNDFKLLVSKAYSDINNAATDAASAIGSMIKVINYPATIERNVKSRVTALKFELNKYNNSITDSISKNSKILYEVIAGTLLSAIALAKSTPIPSDYKTRSIVLDSIQDLLDSTNLYWANLDLIQTDTADEIDSFVPSFDNMFNLDNTINNATSNLFKIAFNAKQERILILENDSNIILLTHRFYGLASDENIDLFMESNNIGLNETLTIKKNRKLTYLV